MRKQAETPVSERMESEERQGIRENVDRIFFSLVKGRRWESACLTDAHTHTLSSCDSGRNDTHVH